MMKPKNFIIDVDGVFTTGQFLYTEEGKFAKIFGPHDNDGIKLLGKLMNIQTISADKRGFGITKKRIADDMHLKLELVSEEDRLNWLKKNFNLDESVFMGDSMHDARLFELVGYSIAPASAFYLAREKADFVTSHKAGEGAVAEACLHIIDKFFKSV
ncbi:MAG: HAD hydrolase family protein [Candidatus Zambryskibacteria bacterium]|nr:HAD hydrolase family protein [Candidatus Zambryskibacteria bacterium]